MTHLADKECPWQFCFELQTLDRSFTLFAPTKEERDLWVNGFHALMGIPVQDPDFENLNDLIKRRAKKQRETMRSK